MSLDKIYILYNRNIQIFVSYYLPHTTCSSFFNKFYTDLHIKKAISSVFIYCSVQIMLFNNLFRILWNVKILLEMNNKLSAFCRINKIIGL